VQSLLFTKCGFIESGVSRNTRSLRITNVAVPFLANQEIGPRSHEGAQDLENLTVRKMVFLDRVREGFTDRRLRFFHNEMPFMNFHYQTISRSATPHPTRTSPDPTDTIGAHPVPPRVDRLTTTTPATPSATLASTFIFDPQAIPAIRSQNI
jgi:hypothetical protein